MFAVTLTPFWVVTSWETTTTLCSLITQPSSPVTALLRIRALFMSPSWIFECFLLPGRLCSICFFIGGLSKSRWPVTPELQGMGRYIRKKDKPWGDKFPRAATVLSTFLPFISSSLSVCLVSSCHGVDSGLLWGIRVWVVPLTVSSRGIGQGVSRVCLQGVFRRLCVSGRI